MQLPQLLISQAHKDRLGLRRKRRPKSASARRKASIRPAQAAELAYRKALREFVGMWAARVTEAIGGLLPGTVEARTDAAETPKPPRFRIMFEYHPGTGPDGKKGGQYGGTFKTREAAERALATRQSDPVLGPVSNGTLRVEELPAKAPKAAAAAPAATAAPVSSTSSARAEVRDALGTLKKQAKGAGKGQTRLINTVADRVDRSNASEFKRVIGVDVASLGASVTHKLDAFLEENVDLITSIASDMLDEVGDAVEAAWTTGTRVEDLADLVQKRFDVTESRADLIARDQTLKLNSQLASTRASSSGIRRARWCTSNDERVRGNPSGLYPNPSKTGKERPDHYHLDGQEYEVGVGLVVSPDGRVCEPGQDYQCRCTAEFILDWLEDDSGQTEEE